MNDELYKACYTGNKKMAEFAIANGANYFNTGLKCACEGGHLDMAELMISKGADAFEWGMRVACEEGHIDIVELMISKGADNWNWGLISAAIGHHNHIIKLMLDNGADINTCALAFEPIMYLLQAGVTNFGIHSGIADDRRKYLLEFQNVTKELFIKDIANIIIKY